MLNSHSELHAPIEMHVRRLTVNLTTEPVQQAMRTLGHSNSDIELILWDRMLDRELAKSGTTSGRSWSPRTTSWTSPR